MCCQSYPITWSQSTVEPDITKSKVMEKCVRYNGVRYIGALFRTFYYNWAEKIYIYLIRCFGVKYRRIFLRVVLYYNEPAGLIKIQTTSKNIRRYFTRKHLIRDLLSDSAFFNLFQ